jgi:4-amino-4-deoxy-L-arabinose transferase-like glycosyltransferase
MATGATQERKTRVPVAINNKSIEILCVLTLLVPAAFILLVNNGSTPMLLWDESRNANNALEMSYNGHWLVTYFNGLPDHWNTKPPLLIWFMALLLRLGLSPLLAVRLPSMIAGIATVLGIFFFCRFRLQDRAAGLFAGLTLLSAPLFVGWHGARTGDYDSFVTLFTATYTLAFWEYIEAQDRKRTSWLIAAGVALTLSILTKGVGGVLALPSLLLYLLLRGRLLQALRDRKLWLILLAVILVCGGYYRLREHFDPGYLTAVINNDFAGRYLAVNEEHRGGPLFYFKVLALRYEPGFLLLPFCAVPFFRADSRRRSLVLLCLLVPAVLLAVLTKSQTKIFWYIAPATPFLALASGIGLSQALGWLNERRGKLPAVLRPEVAYTAVVLIFCGAIFASIYYYQIALQHKLDALYLGGRYGPLLAEIRQRALTNSLVILDEGANVPGDTTGLLTHYTPEADFYSKLESRRGMQIQVTSSGDPIQAGTWVATCNPRSAQWLNNRYTAIAVLRPNRWCSLDRTLNPK